MAAGKLSSIPVVKTVDVRDINNALNAVRECIRVLSDALTAVGSQANQTTFNAAQGNANIAALQAQIASLQAQLAALAASAVGPTAVYRADQVISVLDSVYPTSNGGVSPVDTQDPTAVFAAIGVAATSAAIGAPVTVRLSGSLSVIDAGFETGRAVYAQNGGGLTQYPSYADVAVPVGVATGAEQMDVRAAWPTLLVQPLYAAGYEDFLPASWKLMRDAFELAQSFNAQHDGVLSKTGTNTVSTALPFGELLAFAARHG
jgi:hypothetical protein